MTLALTGCGGGTENRLAQGIRVEPDEAARFEPGTTMDRIQRAGTIRVGAKIDQPLFSLMGIDGAPQGFDVDTAKIIAAGLGIPAERIEWVETPSKTREEVLEQGKVDMIVSTYTINDKRKQRISFGGPYYEAGQDLMVKSDSTGIAGPEALRASGAKVCSVTGSTPAEKIKQYVDADHLVLFDVISKCADALRTDQVQAVTTDNVILMGLVQQSNRRFRLLERPFTSEPYGVGIKRGDRAFCEFINATLDRARRDGTYERAWRATAGKVSAQTPRLPAPDRCT